MFFFLPKVPAFHTFLSWVNASWVLPILELTSARCLLSCFIRLLLSLFFSLINIEILNMFLLWRKGLVSCFSWEVHENLVFSISLVLTNFRTAVYHLSQLTRGLLLLQYLLYSIHPWRQWNQLVIPDSVKWVNGWMIQRIVWQLEHISLIV